jgi:hypothetical protein
VADIKSAPKKTPKLPPNVIATIFKLWGPDSPTVLKTKSKSAIERARYQKLTQSAVARSGRRKNSELLSMAERVQRTHRDLNVGRRSHKKLTENIKKIRRGLAKEFRRELAASSVKGVSQ